MKKIYLVLSIAIIMLLASCDNGTTTVDPIVRVVSTATSTVYLNLIDKSNGSNETVGPWITANTGETTSYQSYTSGSFYIAIDSDTDHSSAFVGDTIYLFKTNKEYSVHIDDSVYSVSED